jgi:uncharacterized protein (TIGR02996 family)
MDDADLFAAMRAAPDDAGPRLVYADWLLSRGDARGELIVLGELERAGSLATLPQLDRLLELASEHGFPRLPDDPCAEIFPFTGGGAYPTQYDLDHGGHNYYLRWRYGFSIDVDDETVLEGDLDTLTTNEWTFRETTVILSIVSAAIRSGQPLSELVFPDQAGFRAHPRYHVGRAPFYSFPDGLYPPGRLLEPRDFGRWYRLWERRQRLAGVPSEPPRRVWRCACGVEGLTCGVQECEAELTRSPAAAGA